jgi:hypothetical protein
MLLQRHLSLVLATLLVIGPLAPASFAEEHEVRVVVDRANLRAEPTPAGRVLAQAPRGTVLRVVEDMGDWYLVKAPGLQPGYVSKTVVKLVAARPVMTPPPAAGAAPVAPPVTATATAPTPATPTISHDPLACMAADANPLVLADITAQAQVHKSRVYFKAHQFPDWYYVDMKVPNQPHYQALLPQPLPDTDKVDYYIHALDTTLETARTDQFEPEVRKAGCRPDERAAAAQVDPQDATQLVVGGTKEGQPPIPPGFSKKGIFAFVAVTGAVVTGAALVAAATTTAAATTAGATTAAATTAAATTTTAAAAGTAGAGAAGTATAATGTATVGAGGMSGGAIAGIVGGSVVVVGVGGYLGYKAINNATNPCTSASDLEKQSGGGIVAVGDETICTTWASCGRRNVRACVANYCSTSNCSIYYQFQDGARFNCTNSCGSGDYSGIYNCANSAVNHCN